MNNNFQDDYAFALSLQEQELRGNVESPQLPDRRETQTGILGKIITGLSRFSGSKSAGNKSSPSSYAPMVENFIEQRETKLSDTNENFRAIMRESTPPTQQNLPSIDVSHNIAIRTPKVNITNEICPICLSPVSILFGFLAVKDRKYHRECFNCGGCGDAVREQFSLKDDIPYHINCYQAFCSPRCYLCNEILPNTYVRPNKLLEPLNEGICPRHIQESRTCFSCRRFEPSKESKKETFIELSDGRVCCLDCLNTAVFDSSEAKTLYLSAIDFLEYELHFPIPNGMREVPILVVDTHVINQQWREMGSSSPHGVADDVSAPGPSGNTSDHVAGGSSEAGRWETALRGLTVSTVGEIRHYESGGVYFDPTLRELCELPPTIINLEQIRKVTAVLVLYGLPRDLTAAIIAHEAMHVWLRLTKDMPSGLPSWVEEGLCQLVSCRFLGRNDVVGVDSRGRDESIKDKPWSFRFRRFCQLQIELDPTHTYGEGFRAAARACNEIGLEVLLDHVKESKTFPVFS